MDQEVAVNGAKERGGGTKLWTMYLKWNGKLGNSEKLRGPRNNIWKPIESLKQQKKLQKKTVKLNSLLALTTVVIKIEFSKEQKGWNETMYMLLRKHVFEMMKENSP